MNNERKIIHWKPSHRDDWERSECYKCSECNYTVDFLENYCPNCGGKSGGKMELRGTVFER